MDSEQEAVTVFRRSAGGSLQAAVTLGPQSSDAPTTPPLAGYAIRLADLFA